MADSTDNTQYRGDQNGFDDLEKPLAGDGASPASAPTDIPEEQKLPLDYPQTDANVDAHEAYDAGTATASGMDDGQEDQAETERRVA